MHRWLSGEARRASLLWRRAVLGAVVAAGFLAPVGVQAAPAACATLQEKYPDWKGKTLVNAINPHTPGYEAIDPKDPSKYVGFDIDLGEEIGECLGFKLTYKAVTFAALLTTLASGQADIVISDIYATEERAKAADFITYSKVFDGVLVANGNPKKITGINTSMCGAACLWIFSANSHRPATATSSRARRVGHRSQRSARRNASRRIARCGSAR